MVFYKGQNLVLGNPRKDAIKSCGLRETTKSIEMLSRKVGFMGFGSEDVVGENAFFNHLFALLQHEFEWQPIFISHLLLQMHLSFLFNLFPNFFDQPFYKLIANDYIFMGNKMYLLDFAQNL